MLIMTGEVYRGGEVDAGNNNILFVGIYVYM